jgi:cytochrome P450
VWAGASTAHYDNEYYPDADEFDGFRFANMREAGEGASDGSNLRHHMVTTSTTYLAFGHGEAHHPSHRHRRLTFS